MVENIHRGWLARLVVVPLAIVLLSSGNFATAQNEPVIQGPDGQRMSRDQIRAMMESRRGGRGGPRPDQPPSAAPPEAAPAAAPAAEGEEKKEEPDNAVKRPEKPPRVPDPREFEVALDDKGRVPPFNFIGQPWPDVLQWLANISKCSLDWQELPNDYLNLTTQRSYAVDEVRDLVNRHLTARGYVSIQAGEVLSVFKIEKLDPSLVRRINEDELYDSKAYDYVKVSFELPADMEVDKAKDDVKQVLSPHAKVFPLVSTRRLLVMDSVANLRTVSELLNEERATKDGRIVPKEFVLRHARPEKVIEILYVILGVDPKAKPSQTDPNVMRQQMEMMQQMQQRGQDMSKLMPKADEPKVHLAYNRQRNSVLANAPPAQMKIIEQTIAYLDVPYGGDFGAAAGVAGVGDGGHQRVMKKYPLTTLDPENFVTTLAEIGGLSPFAEFKIDEKSKTLFALATDADHEKINGLIDQFDGTGREFEVIWLRRLPADAVAATIFNLMGGQTQEEEQDDRRSYFGWYDRGREQKKEKPVKGFGVDADIENNRLLLWANEAEMERVRGLLVKLGEIPAGRSDPRPVRFVQPADGRVTPELLEQLRELWSASGGQELIIKTPAKTSEKSEQKDAEPQDTRPAEDRATSLPGGPRVVARFVQFAEAAEDHALEQAVDESVGVAEANSPITITVTEDGRLMLSSSDTVALDQLEELIEQLSPPDKRFRVYRMKHIPALHMYWDLTDYFADDLKAEEGGYTRDWFGFRVPLGNQDKKTGLSRRRKLMITYDTPSNSILVANASASQLAEVEQLIEEFDRPAPTDSVEIRETAAIKIHYSRPSIIANAVKEVYRDLLSSRDKEFDRGDQREQRASSERVTQIYYGGSSSSGESSRPSPLKVGFNGALSLGPDDVSGILIVSAQKAIFDDIVRMVRELDQEAAPQTTVHVHRINGNVSAAALRKALDQAVTKPWLGNRPEQPTAAATAPAESSGESDRSRDRRSSRRDRD